MSQDKHNNSNLDHQNYLIIIAVLSGIIFLLLVFKNRQPVIIATPTSLPIPISPSEPLPQAATVYVNITGQGNNISILEGNSAIDSGNFNFTGQGQSSSIYIPYRTRINLSFSGQGNDVITQN